MSIPTAHTHLGFPVSFDEIEPEMTLTMRKATHDALATVQSKVDWTIKDLREKLAQAEIKIAGLSKTSEPKQ